METEQIRVSSWSKHLNSMSPALNLYPAILSSSPPTIHYFNNFMRLLHCLVLSSMALTHSRLSLKFYAHFVFISFTKIIGTFVTFPLYETPKRARPFNHPLQMNSSSNGFLNWTRDCKALAHFLTSNCYPLAIRSAASGLLTEAI